MYQVFNVLTGEAIPVLSDTQYELAGPLGDRQIEQKRDEAGNLLYYGESTDAVTETTESTYTLQGESETFIIDRQPIWVDSGPLYAWREVLPTDTDQAAEVQRSLVNSVQAHLDATAHQYGYDDIKSAVTYADEPAVPKFQLEGQAFREWRSLVWQYCYAQLDAVTAGTRTVPTAAKLILELPLLQFK